MSSETKTKPPLDRHRADDTGWISFGAFLIIAAVIYLTTPNLGQGIKSFILDFQLVKVFENFWWFEPMHPHPALYTAMEHFCYAFGAVQLGILGLRFVTGSYIRGKAETFSGAVFWLGAGYLLSLLGQGALPWFSFIAGLIILVGISIVVQALIMAFSPRHTP